MKMVVRVEREENRPAGRVARAVYSMLTDVSAGKPLKRSLGSEVRPERPKTKPDKPLLQEDPHT